MFKDIICLLSGFLTAYLILRAVRSFRGGVGVLVFYLLGCEVQGCVFYVQNTLSSTAYLYNDYGHPGTWTYASVVLNPNYTTGVSTSDPTLCNWGAGPNSSGTVLQNMGPGACGGTLVYNGGVTVTNYSKSFVFVNTNKYAQTLTLRFTNLLTGGKMTNYLLAISGTNSFFTTNVFGNGVPYGAGMQWPGDITSDFQPAQVGGNADANTGATNQPGGLGQVESYQDPLLSQPGTGSLANSNANVLSGQQTQLIVDALGKILDAVGQQSDLLDYDLGNLEGAMTNQNGGNSTNWAYMDQLQRIQTNTHNAANDIGLGNLSAYGNGSNITGWIPSIYTNLFGGSNGVQGNIPGVFPSILSNLAGPSAGTVTQGYGSNYGVLMAVATNAVSSAMAPVSGLTNGITMWSTNAPDRGDPSACIVHLPTVLGCEYVLNLNPFDWASQGIGLQFTAAMPFIRKWLAWGLCMTLFWLVVDRLDECQRTLLMAGSSGTQPGGGGLLNYGVRLVTVPFLITLIGALIAVLPAVCITLLTTWGIAAPWTGVSVVDSMLDEVGGGTALNVIREWWNFSWIFIPYDVLFICLVVWPLVFFGTQWYITILWLGFRVLGLISPVLVLGYCSVCEMRADQVRFENWTGATMVISNDMERLALPVGVTEDLVLAAGDWSCGTNEFPVYGPGTNQTVRFGELGPVLVAQSYTGYDWWAMGMNLGFVVFGTAWAISCARSGILLRVRE